MDDGRVVFCRWDYGVNKNVFNRHALWTQNPDGTGVDLYFGNTVIDPYAILNGAKVLDAGLKVITLGVAADAVA